MALGWRSPRLSQTCASQKDARLRESSHEHWMVHYGKHIPPLCCRYLYLLQNLLPGLICSVQPGRVPSTLLFSDFLMLPIPLSSQFQQVLATAMASGMDSDAEQIVPDGEESGVKAVQARYLRSPSPSRWVLLASSISSWWRGSNCTLFLCRLFYGACLVRGKGQSLMASYFFQQPGWGAHALFIPLFPLRFFHPGATGGKAVLKFGEARQKKQSPPKLQSLTPVHI